MWKVNDKVELVDEAFDKFIGKVARGREVLPEEIKVREIDSTSRAKNALVQYESL